MNLRLVYECLEEVYGIQPVQARAIMLINDSHADIEQQERNDLVRKVLSNKHFAAWYISETDLSITCSSTPFGSESC